MPDTQETAQKLLSDTTLKLSAIREAKKRFSAQLAPEFSLFDFLRNDEMGLSACIASLLDPQGTHGQGRAFLELFLDMVGEAADWARQQTCRAVRTEQQANGMRRIDIYLELENGFIGIENKPWALDQDNQLKDYATHLECQASNGKHWLLIYLSNSEPAQNSIKLHELDAIRNNQNYTQINYHSLAYWLDTCAGQTRALQVRVFIEELAKFVRSKINGEHDMSEQNEISSLILASTDSITSAFNIANAIYSAKKTLLEKLKNDLQEAVKEKNLRLTWDINESLRAC